MATKNQKRGARGARREKPEFEQKLLDLARVTRVVKGGRRFRFRATLAIGDRKGRVGLGVAKGADVSDSINKAMIQAKKSLIQVPIDGNTIPHDIKAKFGSAKVLLKPAQEGQGLIAGGAVRTMVDLAGVHDVVSKSLGASNKINVAKATMLALSSLKKRRVASTLKKNKEVESKSKDSTEKVILAKKSVTKKTLADKVVSTKK